MKSAVKKRTWIGNGDNFKDDSEEVAQACSKSVRKAKVGKEMLIKTS